MKGARSAGRKRGGWRRVHLACACIALGLLAGAATAAPRVILLSWDGVRHDYPDRTETPALDRMARDGVRAQRLVPVFPSNTFPNHVSLATGTFPDRHGIVDNRFFDRQRGAYRMEPDADWIQAEPLWAAAERQGVAAAVYFWVGSETPWRGVAARYRKAPFDADVGEAQKVEQILAWLDLPEPERPRLVMAWWHGADHVGHTRGPQDPRVAAALRAQDAQLARLIAGLDARGAWSETTLIVVSDHGMTRVRGEVPLRKRLAEAGIDARIAGGATLAHLFLDRTPRDAAERALAALPHARIWRGDALPAALRVQHPTRTGDLVVAADPGFVFGGAGSFSERSWRRLRHWLGSDTGSHGYPPEEPDMGAVLLALGRGARPGARPAAPRAIDVAPTVAALLGMQPPQQSEGTPIGELLEGIVR